MSIHVDETPGDIPQNVCALVTRRIYRSSPGAFLLLVCSSLFGAINLYSELPEGHALRVHILSAYDYLTRG